MKKIIAACGSGVAISQMVAIKVNKLLKQRNIQAEVVAISIKDLPQHIESSIAYLEVVKTKEEVPLPTINGIAFLNGVGQEEELEKLIQTIENAK